MIEKIVKVSRELAKPSWKQVNKAVTELFFNTINDLDRRGFLMIGKEKEMGSEILLKYSIFSEFGDYLGEGRPGCFWNKKIKWEEVEKHVSNFVSAI